MLVELLVITEEAIVENDADPKWLPYSIYRLVLVGGTNTLWAKEVLFVAQAWRVGSFTFAPQGLNIYIVAVSLLFFFAINSTVISPLEFNAPVT